MNRDDIKTELLKAAKRGATKRDAAQLAGISERTLYNWLAQNAQFADDYGRASAEGRMKSIKLIADSDDWRAHAWLLERVDPDHWGRDSAGASLGKKLDAYLEGVADGSGAATGHVLELNAGPEA